MSGDGYRAELSHHRSDQDGAARNPRVGRQLTNFGSQTRIGKEQREKHG